MNATTEAQVQIGGEPRVQALAVTTTTSAPAGLTPAPAGLTPAPAGLTSDIPFHPTGYRWNVRGDWYPDRAATIGHLIADHGMTIDAAMGLNDDELRRVHDEIHNRQMVGQVQADKARNSSGMKAAAVGLGIGIAILYAIFGGASPRGRRSRSASLPEPVNARSRLR